MLSSIKRGLLLALASTLLVAATTSPAHNVSAASTAFSFNWTGVPAAPQPWTPGLVNDWDLIVHSRDYNTLDQLDPIPAQHGTTCGPFPATHTVTAYTDAVFICNNHMMTALNAGGYGQIMFTPSQLVDFSGGTATVTFQVSTFDSAPGRDWFDLWISPVGENLVLPAFGLPPDLQGPPKHGVQVELQADETFEARYYNNFQETDLPKNDGTSFSTFLAPSASTRSTFQLQISQTHIRFGMPGVNGGSGEWWIDTNMPGLPFNQGLVQFGHHSYDPGKDGHVGNTWHWSNVSISPAVPFTMLRGDLTYLHAGTPNAVHFAGAAPPNSFLRFAALASTVSVSFDGGASFQPAQMQAQRGPTEGQFQVNHDLFINYWTPVPAGATSVVFRAQDSSGPWHVSDVSIWSSSAATIVPVPVPSPSNNPGGTASGGPTGTGSGGTPEGLESEPGTSSDPEETHGTPASEPESRTAGGSGPGASGEVAGAAPPVAHENDPDLSVSGAIEVARRVVQPGSIQSGALLVLAIIALVGVVVAAAVLTRRQPKARPRTRPKL